ncbi:MAG: hypothetical protein CM1200mP20_12310 [Pseudomonadota bacterium]|nr:MAG: hypothetical protein CM1200mP20_12310 [Pseudomonadota bacterium]
MPLSVAVGHWFCPRTKAEEAALVAGADLLPAQHLTELTAHLSGKEPIVPVNRVPTQLKSSSELDLCDVRGQHLGRRGGELASGPGGHDLLLIGPPGCGKTMLAERLPGLLPPMTEAEALETACIYSVSRAGFEHGGWRKAAFQVAPPQCIGRCTGRGRQPGSAGRDFAGSQRGAVSR